MAGGLAAGTLVAACQPQTVVVEKEVEKEVTRVVKETVKETVVVEGTPKVVEKEVTKIVEVEKEVTIAPKEVAVVKWCTGEIPYYFQRYFTAFAPLFNASHEDVQVEYICPDGSTIELFPQLVAAGEDVDITVFHSQRMPAFAREGIILQLDDFYELDLADIEERMYPNVMVSLTWNNKIWGTPTDYLPFIPVFNADLYNAEGVELPSEVWERDEKEWNWDTMLDQLLRLTKFDDTGAPTQFGIKIRTDFYGTWHWFWGAGAEIFNADRTEAIFNSPEGVEAMQFLQDLMWEYHVAGRAGEIDPGVHSLRGGAVCLEWQFSGGHNLRGMVKFLFDAAPVPYGPRGRSTLARTNDRVINVNSKRKEAAWEVCKWAAFSDECIRLAMQTDYSVPCLKGFEEEFLQLWVPPTHPEYVLDGCLTGIPDPPFSIWSSHMGPIWNEEMEPCWSEERRNVKDALDAAAQRMNEALVEEYEV
jgi:multiple sugar transport system substrate-binding protein